MQANMRINLFGHSLVDNGMSKDHLIFLLTECLLKYALFLFTLFQPQLILKSKELLRLVAYL